MHAKKDHQPTRYYRCGAILNSLLCVPPLPVQEADASADTSATTVVPGNNDLRGD